MTGLSRALVLVAGIAHAMPALAVEWTQYRIQDTARRCAGLPAEFAVAASSDRRWVAMQAPGQLWHWQRNAAGEVVQVQFWAQDLGAGVLWRDPLELADMEGNPIAADLQRRLHQPAHPH